MNAEQNETRSHCAVGYTWVAATLMQSKSLVTICTSILVVIAASSTATAAPAVGAAPRGEATAVAARIIKYNFPQCKRVTSAVRAGDGSIRATCDGIQYLVFTLFNAREGKAIELALNCVASKKLLNVSC